MGVTAAGGAAAAPVLYSDLLADRDLLSDVQRVERIGVQVDNSLVGGAVVDGDGGKAAAAASALGYSGDFTAGQGVDSVTVAALEVNAFMSALGVDVSVKTAGDVGSGAADTVEGIGHELGGVSVLPAIVDGGLDPCHTPAGGIACAADVVDDLSIRTAGSELVHLVVLGNAAGGSGGGSTAICSSAGLGSYALAGSGGTCDDREGNVRRLAATCDRIAAIGVILAAAVSADAVDIDFVGSVDGAFLSGKRRRGVCGGVVAGADGIDLDRLTRTEGGP